MSHVRQKTYMTHWIVSLAIFFSVLTSAFIFFYPRGDATGSPQEQNKKFVRKNKATRALLHTFQEKLDPAFGNPTTVSANSRTPIDVVYVMMDRDIDVARESISSVKSMVMHPLKKFILIGPKTPKMIAFAQEMKCTLVDETTLLENFDTIKKHSGWVLQQFLKLSAQKVAEQEHFLIVDADTLFIRPQIFIKDKGIVDKNTPQEKPLNFIVNIHFDCFFPRKKACAELLGLTRVWQLDFVTHHMLFSKKQLAAMKKHIEALHGDRWDLVVLEKVVKKDRFSLSEYDLYGMYLTELSGEDFIFTSNANRTVPRTLLPYVDKISASLSHECKSISLHHFYDFKSFGETGR